MAIPFDDRTIDRFVHVPKYRQLADRIRDAIDAGDLVPGEELPGEQPLASAVGISRDAVRKAFDVLVGEGRLARRHGAATRVAQPPPVRRMDASRYVEELEQLRAGDHPASSAFTVDHGITWSQYDVDVDIAQDAASDRDAEHLGVKPGTKILRRRFVKYVDGEPVQLQRSAIPWDIAGGTELANPANQPWPGGTIAELYSLGHVVTRVVEDVTARTSSDEERRALHMETPGPVFDVVRVFWCGDRPVEASRVIVPAARNVLHYETSLSLD